MQPISSIVVWIDRWVEAHKPEFDHDNDDEKSKARREVAELAERLNWLETRAMQQERKRA